MDRWVVYRWAPVKEGGESKDGNRYEQAESISRNLPLSSIDDNFYTFILDISTPTEITMPAKDADCITVLTNRSDVQILREGGIKWFTIKRAGPKNTSTLSLCRRAAKGRAKPSTWHCLHSGKGRRHRCDVCRQ